MSFVFFDIDGTLIQSPPYHLWRGLMAYWQTRGRKQGVHRVFLATHYPLFALRKAGLLAEGAFRRRWSADLGWYLRGETTDAVAEMSRWVARVYLRDAWRVQVVRRLQAHLEAGDVVALVSAAPLPIVAAVAEHWGVPHAVGTRFEQRNGRYTGRVMPPVALDAQKLGLARAHFERLGIPFDLGNSWAYADSITDLALLEAAAHPVAVFPDRALQAIAEQSGWEVLVE